MSSGALSDPARTLIRQHIDSVGRLDLLIVLYGDAGARWSAERMARQMRASTSWAQGEMQALQRAGMLTCEEAEGGPAWRYDPAEEAVAAAVTDLVDACRVDWPGVTRAVTSLRSDGAQAFSDAFRLRKRDG